MSVNLAPAGNGEPSPPVCAYCQIPTQHIDSGKWDAGVYWCLQCGAVYATKPEVLGFRTAPIATDDLTQPPVAIWWIHAPRLKAPEPAQSAPRLTFDLATNTITLDGARYEALDPAFVRVMKTVADAAPNKISRAEVTAKTGIERPDRLFEEAKEDAAALERLVLRGKGNNGYQLVLPANKSDIQSS
jgi:hypothetical protein